MKREELVAIMAAPIYAQIAKNDLDRWRSKGGDGGTIRQDLRWMAIREADLLLIEIERKRPQLAEEAPK